MEQLINLAVDQPLGLGLLILLFVLFMLEKIVPGGTHARALETIKEQQRTIDDLRATARANTESNKLAADFFRALDDRVRRDGEK